jgi:nitroreductase
MPTSAVREDGGTDHDVVGRLLRYRHSCRAFSPEPLPRALIEAMLETAQRTATWCNVQPWRVIVTEGEGTERFRTGLQDAVQREQVNADIPLPREYHGVYQERRRDSGLALYETLGIARDDQAGRMRQSLENFRLFGAPHALIVHSDAKLGEYGYIDCGGYIANLLIAAESLGIAAIPQAAIAMQSRFIHQHFDLPEDRVVVAGVSFGWEAEHQVNQFRTSRAELPDVVSWVDA